ncbi:bacteriocin class II with double-glycine leader peptide family protein [Streptococcus pseudoporcinus]|uniref:Bacteriocin class II with double-glycine leader peptide family protein n=1 Tax=Streptococcus pseudoporcinus TaxID=361101 RepID=A0A4U9Z4W0_9STRE|nr:Blp family class II bacteriocin [Streptococcus pseudoporcinus]VTS35213.1 bacteriocin class II with double-glycine leader peptide family protein [Streptococcus pseudoporcinus]
MNIAKQNEILSDKSLLRILGGYNATDCKNHLIGGISSGAIAGGVGAGLTTLGVGGVAGAFVGAHIGAVAGGLTCVGGMIGNKF